MIGKEEAAMDMKTYPTTAPAVDPADEMDRAFRAQVARATSGISQIGMGLAFVDWLAHLAISPGRQLSLAMGAIDAAQAAANAVASAAISAGGGLNSKQPVSAKDTPRVADRRFQAEAWSRWPYNVVADSYVSAQRQWARATAGVNGVSERSERIVVSAVRQWMDMLSPSNIPWLNPEVIEATRREGGANLARGLMHWIDDAHKLASGKANMPAQTYRLGADVAATPGKVVLRNALMELIQYAPTTPQVHAEPVLIVPAWIMKYYILDLSPGNSMVRYLVDQGHTVFMISWKNPTADDRDKGMDDYRRDGVMAAIDAVSTIVPDRKIHAAGYCLGGTMLSIAAAAMGREHDDRLASITLFAAQTDFTEAGELMLFINESEMAMLDAMMWEHGVLDTYQMAGAFQMLRSNDLVWARILKEYMLGQRDMPNDLMAWNADATRMPYRMHTEYLRRLFLNNELARGHYEVDGRPVWLNDIRLPYFVVGTAADHVAPWRSVYKVHLSPNEVTFVLTSGGHNAGIVSEPGHAGRKYQMQMRTAAGDYVDPESWKASAPTHEGSWWPAWQAWLAQRSSGMCKPPRVGLAKGRGKQDELGDAPGRYVHQS